MEEWLRSHRSWSTVIANPIFQGSVNSHKDRAHSHLPTGLAGPPPFWIGPGLATGGGGFLFFSSSYLKMTIYNYTGDSKLSLSQLYQKESEPEPLSFASGLLLFLILIYFLGALSICLHSAHTYEMIMILSICMQKQS